MAEWMVEIETRAAASTADELERFAAALDEARGTTGAAASLQTTTQILSAAFSVDAAEALDAVETGVTTFRAALTAAGLRNAPPTRVSVEQAVVPEPVSA